MSAGLRIVNPAALGVPKGYSNGIVAPPGSRLLFVAGQVGWDAPGRLVSDDFVAQFEQALANTLAVVREAGGGAEHVVRMTIYVADRFRYLERLADVGAAYRRQMGKHFPAMSLVEVSALLEGEALVEIEATAALPADRDRDPEAEPPRSR